LLTKTELSLNFKKETGHPKSILWGTPNKKTVFEKKLIPKSPYPFLRQWLTMENFMQHQKETLCS